MITYTSCPLQEGLPPPTGRHASALLLWSSWNRSGLSLVHIFLMQSSFQQQRSSLSAFPTHCKAVYEDKSEIYTKIRHDLLKRQPIGLPPSHTEKEYPPD